MDWRKLGGAVWEFVSILALSLIAGIGIGFFQGELSTGEELGDIRMTLAERRCIGWRFLGIPTGLIAYCVLLGSRVCFRLLRSIVVVNGKPLCKISRTAR